MFLYTSEKTAKVIHRKEIKMDKGLQKGLASLSGRFKMAQIADTCPSHIDFQ